MGADAGVLQMLRSLNICANMYTYTCTCIYTNLVYTGKLLVCSACTDAVNSYIPVLESVYCMYSQKIWQFGGMPLYRQ